MIGSPRGKSPKELQVPALGSGLVFYLGPKKFVFYVFVPESGSFPVRDSSSICYEGISSALGVIVLSYGSGSMFYDRR